MNPPRGIAVILIDDGGGMYPNLNNVMISFVKSK
jgi:hypothetical protein